VGLGVVFVEEIDILQISSLTEACMELNLWVFFFFFFFLQLGNP